MAKHANMQSYDIILVEHAQYNSRSILWVSLQIPEAC